MRNSPSLTFEDTFSGRLGIVSGCVRPLIKIGQGVGTRVRRPMISPTVEALPQSWQAKEAQEQKQTQILAPSTFARTKHGRRQKEEPTSKRRRIVCGALRRPLRRLSGGAGPPAVTPHRVAGEPEGARRPESIESAEPTAKRVKLNTAHRPLVLLGHAERFAAKRRWVAGPRRRRRLARQEPSHKKKPRQHKKERCSNLPHLFSMHQIATRGRKVALYCLSQV